MEDPLEQVRGLVRRLRAPPRGAVVVAGVSGGVDSIVLLEVLRALSEERRWRVVVAHFNHRLRGAASESDEAFVRGVAIEAGLPFEAAQGGVEEEAARQGISVEMAARWLRHRFLADVAARRGASWVALGHHADDQVETFFLRLFRGAGGEGLAGMRTVAPSPAGAGVRLWRPFLGLARRELLEFARARGLRWVEDASNDDRTILRNRLRTELLPLLREQYQPGLDATVRRAMEITGGETECVGEIAQAWLRSRGEAVRGSLPVPAWVVALEAALGSVPFARLPVPVQRRILAGQLAALGLAPNFTWIEALLSPSCPPVTVAPGLRLRRTARGRLVAVPTQAPGFCRAREEVRLTGARGSVEFGGFRFRWRVERARGAPWPLPRRAGREYFDAAETGAGLTLRHWAPGDRFQPLGLGAAAKLQDLFVNAHVPAAERHRRVLAATADGRIVWVQGLRIGEAFKVRPETRQRLEWRWRRAPAAAAASSTPGAGGICGTQGRPLC